MNLELHPCKGCNQLADLQPDSFMGNKRYCSACLKKQKKDKRLRIKQFIQPTKWDSISKDNVNRILRKCNGVNYG